MAGRIAQLSLAGLRMAASSTWTDAAVIARWLYRFGTVPRGPAIDRDFGPEDDPMAILGLTMNDGTRRLLETAYEATFLPGWCSFAGSAAGVQLAPVCKLYVSPRPQALADAFPRIADAFVRHDVRSFKVGRGIAGLLRPDKIVAYFDDHGQLADVTGALERSLRGCPAQGVPFTAELDDNGLLSFGTDPPGDAAVSWRSWLTKRLGASLATHRALQHPDPVAATLADLRSACIDPEGWKASAEALADVAHHEHHEHHD